uniref:universal stress protein PHOS34-like n=1 Tax=Styela clava TaxID=7725 RepID=UPI001939A7D6|nr:universal stress protein PHOS34-like [Styela clava]
MSRQVQEKQSEGLRVMICVDGSHNSEVAFERYAEKIHRPENEVVLVHVAEFNIAPSQLFFGATPPVGIGITSPSASTESTIRDSLEDEKRRTKAIETKFRKKCKDNGIKFSFLRLTDSGQGIGQAIVEAAIKHDAQFIVTGTRGRGIVRRTILGSVSEYVLHHSLVPTLLCPKDC